MPSAGASLETIASDVLFITFPVTDGDKLRRPDNMRPPAPSAREVNWFRTMTMEEKYSCRWRNLIGQGIAKLLDKPNKEKYCLQSFPEGYWMFDHNKGPISNIRHDLYLFGSRSVLRFRSPAEFIPHGYWLLTDSTLNNKNCGCKYCGGGGKKSQTEISEALGLPTNRGPTAVTGSTRMRIGTQRPSRPKRTRGVGVLSADSLWEPKEMRKERKSDPAWQLTSVNLKLAANNTRIADLRSSRRFRTGELVWCTCEYASQGQASPRPPGFWPAIVLDHRLEPSVQRPPLTCDPHTIVQRRLYSVVHLAASPPEMNRQSVCTSNEDTILPWNAHHMDLSSRLSLNTKSGDSNKQSNSLALALHTAKRLVSVWAVCDRLPVEIPVSSAHKASQQVGNGVSRGIQSSLPSGGPCPLNNQIISSRSTPSLAIPYPIDTTLLPQRSSARLAPPSPAKRTQTSSDAQPSRTPKGSTCTETQYEGLWYGPERIWTGDVVRLCPERDAFAASLELSSRAHGEMFWQQKTMPSPGASMRGVLMRINKIFARVGKAGSKECAIAGSLYEIAPKAWTDEARSSGDATVSHSFSTTSSLPESPIRPWDMSQTPPPRDRQKVFDKTAFHRPDFPLPPAPPGYTLRLLLPAGYELPLPVSFIAGRYYPDILQWPLVNIILPTTPKMILSLSQLAAADAREVRLLSLCGLVPGRYNSAVCKDVRLAIRTRMLEEAVHRAQIDLGVRETKDLDIVDID